MTASVSERVSAGFTLLDEHKPGWYTRIDLGRLNVISGWDCPAGQAFAEDAKGAINGATWEPFDRAVNVMFDNSVHLTNKLLEHGFLADGGNWTELTAEWKRQISARLLKDRVAAEADAAAEAFLGIGKDEWDALMPATHLAGLG